MQWNKSEKAYIGTCSDGKHVRVEQETHDRVQRGQPELTPDMWAALFEKESGVDLEFGGIVGKTDFMRW